MTQYGSGSGVRGDSVNGHGGVFTTQHGDRHALSAQHIGLGGSGAAIRASGSDNVGVDATTDNANGPAIRARASGSAGTGAAIEALGVGNAGLVARTDNGDRYAVDAQSGPTGGTAAAVRAAGVVTTGLEASTGSGFAFAITAVNTGEPGYGGGLIKASGGDVYGIDVDNESPIFPAIRARNASASSNYGSAVQATSVANPAIDATAEGATANAVRAMAPSTAIYAESTAGGYQSAAVMGVAMPAGATDDTTGVVGIGGPTESFSTGVIGVSNDAQGTGVYGLADGNAAAGVFGSNSNGAAVFGYTSSGDGVNGLATTSGVGVRGTSSSGVGVFGDSSSGDAGYFDGNLYATSASASVKAFRIDHPADPANRVLMHACVESSERLTLYAGTVRTDAAGEAFVEVPAWFEGLNHEVRYQLTPIGDARTWIRDKLAGRRFGIATSVPHTEVCWQLSAVRRDPYAVAHPLVVESDKRGHEKGRYLNPVEHGQPEDLGVAHRLRETARPRLPRGRSEPEAWVKRAE